MEVQMEDLLMRALLRAVKNNNPIRMPFGLGILHQRQGILNLVRASGATYHKVQRTIIENITFKNDIKHMTASDLYILYNQDIGGDIPIDIAEFKTSLHNLCGMYPEMVQIRNAAYTASTSKWMDYTSIRLPNTVSAVHKVIGDGKHLFRTNSASVVTRDKTDYLINGDVLIVPDGIASVSIEYTPILDDLDTITIGENTLGHQALIWGIAYMHTNKLMQIRKKQIGSIVAHAKTKFYTLKQAVKTNKLKLEIKIVNNLE